MKQEYSSNRGRIKWSRKLREFAKTNGILTAAKARPARNKAVTAENNRVTDLISDFERRHSQLDREQILLIGRCKSGDRKAIKELVTL